MNGTTSTRPIALPPAMVFLVASALAAACQSPPEATPAAQSPIAVDTTMVTIRELSEPLEAGGVVAAGESAVIASRILAPVLSVRVHAGDRVAAGQVLVTLDASDIRAHARQAGAAARAAEQGVAQARSQQAAAAADHALARAWRDRVATLQQRNSATRHELDEAEARLAAAQARASGADAGVEYATAQIELHRAAADAASATETFASIVAPFAGVVTERFIDPGSMATPGTPLMRIDAAGPRRVDVRVDESRATYLNPGDRVTVLLAGGGGADAEAAVTGLVTEVDRAVDADQRAFTVKVALPAEVAARSGTFARVRFGGAVRRAVVVPAAAVRRQGQVSSVFVVDAGRAWLRLVHVRSAADGSVEVVSGLEAGEVIVMTPPPALTDRHPVSARTAGVQAGAR